MTTSIAKSSKSFFVKILVGIIILPFVFWGMGDVFRGGNQNIIATIETEKISTQEFMNYVNQLNLNENQVKSLPSTNLIEKILSEYIGRKVMSLEIEEHGVVVSDNALRDIIKNDKLFFKEDKFSRTEYEKFLIKSSITAPQFEANIVEQEKRRQFLSSLASGIVIPEVLVTQEFEKENQIKTIQYIDLENYHSKYKPTSKSIKELYDRNKKIFFVELKSLQYAEIKPENISGSKEYDENFFKQLDIIENNILDGQSFNEAIKNNNLKTIEIDKISSKKEDQNNNKINNLSDNLFNKIYNIKSTQSPEVFNIESKYYLAEIKKTEKKSKPITDPEVLQALKAQLNFKNKIESNTSIAKSIGLGAYDNENYKKFAEDNGLRVKNYTISSLKENEIFTDGLIKKIFSTKDNQVNLITDSTLTKTFLISTKKTEYKELKKDGAEFEKYEAKARLGLINKIYKSYDESINQKYKIELKQKTIDRVKNSF